MTLQLLPDSPAARAALVSPLVGLAPAVLLVAAPTTPPAAPAEAAKPVGLRSDRFALAFWLVCVVLMSILLLKDIVVALFFR
jgi:hypothetical protein